MSAKVGRKTEPHSRWRISSRLAGGGRALGVTESDTPGPVSMPSSPLSRERSAQTRTSRTAAVVQNRPMLGSLPYVSRRATWWLLPTIDYLSATLALTTVMMHRVSDLFPALPLAPLLLVVVNAMLGAYRAHASGRARGTDGRTARLVARLLMAALFAWSTSLLISLGVGAQLTLWATFALVDTAGRAIGSRLLSRLERVERWVLVGDESTTERLSAYQPLRTYAEVLRTIRPSEDHRKTAYRAAALEVVDDCGADRVVIASQDADDESLLDLVRAFKSIGVPVSLLPRPLDLLEALATTPNRIGGVPLIDVEAFARPRAELVPYSGPCRRSGRQVAVSVVVPAINEEENIGAVLSQLPDGLHEVILVDGNSRDNTVEVARQAYPGICLLPQNGRGKGDALRTGFAAVTGNLVVMLDADGSANPAEIPRFVEALEAGADFAKGSRFLKGGGSADITVTRRVGNALLSGMANLLYGTHFTDLCYGYNAFWARCLPFIALDVPGFEVETLINLRIAVAGMKITEVPSYEAARMSGESNLHTSRDGLRVLGVILREARRRHVIHSSWQPPLQTQPAREAETVVP